MVALFGRSWSRQHLLDRVGHLSQVGGVRLVEWADGTERGIRVAEFRSGSGLDFSVLLDRGLDIGPAQYRGIPLAWLSPAGFAHPAFFEPEGFGWLRTFGGGLLVGCGLTHLGEPGFDEGESLGLHGRLSVLPASMVQVGEEWQGDECLFWLEGQVRQACLFGENLSLTRRISVKLGCSTIAVQDRVENLGDASSPLMLLYHINLGFPLLDEGGCLVAEPHPVRAWNLESGGGLTGWHCFPAPTSGFREQVFYHDLIADEHGWAQIALVNARLGIRVTVRFQKATLPNLVEWKMMGRGAYVLGLEPSNCLVEGRSRERARGSLQFIKPGEQREFFLEIRVEETRL